ncbi:MAG: YihY/virulence factor BrkB family protein [Desulfobacterales bacterium]|nr:YihY/virulence factor BrkB family protein [Desulfobacterales bacterium]
MHADRKENALIVFDVKEDSLTTGLKEKRPMIEKVTEFIKTDMWRIRSRTLPWTKSIWIRPLRIITLSLRGFHEDKCLFRASALTFYSLLSIVPILAMAFALAKGFGFENALERQLFERFQGQEEVIAQVMKFARTLLENARGGVMAGAGILLLFWAIIRVLGNIEDSFNHIWEIKKPRGFARKVSDYLSAMLICPLLLIVSSAVTVAITSQVKLVVEKITLLGPISPAIFFILTLLPYCMIWVLFTFIYMFMPNGKVSFRSGMLAGIFAGTLYQIFQLVYLSFQIGVAKYNAIYGSFAALPLFLLWLQLSWMIVLFGAEVSFAHQNEESFEFEPDCSRVSYAFKRLLTLRVVHLLVKDFSQAGNSLSADQIAYRLEFPVRLLRDILHELVEAGVVSETYDSEHKKAAYQPARDIDLFTVRFVIDSLEQHGTDNIPVARSKELEKLSGCLRAFGEIIEKSPANMRLKDM